MSKKQDRTAMSTPEAEYVALFASCAHVERSITELYFVRTEYQLPDLFTKALLQDRFEYLVMTSWYVDVDPGEWRFWQKEIDF
ncbi:hypothetical protein Tco_0167459 [Tanacetum coccineum]